MRTFVGYRDQGIAKVKVRTPQGVRDLGLYLHVRNHSPTGHEWGYQGSGPAQLALSLLISVLSSELARGVREEEGLSGEAMATVAYQDFKFDKVAGWSRDVHYDGRSKGVSELTGEQVVEWEMTDREVLDWFNQWRKKPHPRKRLQDRKELLELGMRVRG